MVLGTMVCPSFVLGGDANTGSAGYVCLETELVDGESDFHSAMPDATASFAAFLGLPSFVAVVCPDASTLFLGGEDDFYAAMPAAITFFAATLGWPSFFVADSPDAATPVFVALSGVHHACTSPNQHDEACND